MLPEIRNPSQLKQIIKVNREHDLKIAKLSQKNGAKNDGMKLNLDLPSPTKKHYVTNSSSKMKKIGKIYKKYKKKTVGRSGTSSVQILTPDESPCPTNDQSIDKIYPIIIYPPFIKLDE